MQSFAVWQFIVKLVIRHWKANWFLVIYFVELPSNADLWWVYHVQLPLPMLAHFSKSIDSTKGKNEERKQFCIFIFVGTAENCRERNFQTPYGAIETLLAFSVNIGWNQTKNCLSTNFSSAFCVSLSRIS